MQGVRQGMKWKGCSQICMDLLMTLEFLGVFPYVPGSLTDKRGHPTKAAERNIFQNSLKYAIFLTRSFIIGPRNPVIFFVIVKAKLA